MWKTTLLRIILGALEPNEGSIYINQKKINSTPISERNIGFVPQNFGLFPHLTVNENIAYGLKIQGFKKPTITLRVAELIDKLKLNSLEKRKITQLSWGQQQRVALARSLAIQPHLLLLDEPLSSVDWIARKKIRKALKKLQKDLDITVIYVTHDIDEAFELGDRITLMNAGKLQQCGTPKEIIKNPKTEFVASFVGQEKSLKRTRMIMELKEN
ncbi:MAG: ABC transporter ATP-binding protein [Promethearchaeia archaeon]